MYQIDVAPTQLANGMAGRFEALDLLMTLISVAGIPVVVGFVALQWWRRDDRLHVRHVLVASGMSFVLGLALNQVVLLFVHRVRPYDAGVTHLIISKSADPSFPSDHATAAAAIAAAFLLHGMRRAGYWLLFAAAMIMLSRVYVGIHYAGDVFGGAWTGLTAALIVLAAFRQGTRFDRWITSIF